MVAGLFLGFAFGMGGLGATGLEELTEQTSIRNMYQVCAFQPLLGSFTELLPNLHQIRTVT
jgi:MFS transporter, FSR family, fosmidomycin resistance protein